MQFSSYDTQGFYDEMFEEKGTPRPHARLLLETVESLSDGHLLRYKHAAERLLLQMGITFNVYGDTAGTERIFPFDRRGYDPTQGLAVSQSHVAVAAAADPRLAAPVTSTYRGIASAQMEFAIELAVQE